MSFLSSLAEVIVAGVAWRSLVSYRRHRLLVLLGRRSYFSLFHDGVRATVRYRLLRGNSFESVHVTCPMFSLFKDRLWQPSRY